MMIMKVAKKRVTVLQISSIKTDYQRGFLFLYLRLVPLSNIKRNMCTPETYIELT